MSLLIRNNGVGFLAGSLFALLTVMCILTAAMSF